MEKIAIKLEEGKSYKIKTPKSAHFKSNKIHIDKIIKSPYYTPHDEWVDNSEDLIVYRIWSRKGGFKWFVSPFWEICIWNNWSYKK